MYAAAVRIVELPSPVFPRDIPITGLREQYPNLTAVRFRLPRRIDDATSPGADAAFSTLTVYAKRASQTPGWPILARDIDGDAGNPADEDEKGKMAATPEINSDQAVTAESGHETQIQAK